MSFGLFVIIALAALVLPGLLRCRVEASVTEGGFSLQWSVAGLPLSRSKRKVLGNNHRGRRASLERKEMPPDLLLLRDRARLLLRLLASVLRHGQVDSLVIQSCVSFPEPYDTVMAYSGLSLLLQRLKVMAQEKVRELKLENDLDFFSPGWRLTAGLRASMPLGFFAFVVLHGLYGHHKSLRAFRRRAGKG